MFQCCRFGGEPGPFRRLPFFAFLGRLSLFCFVFPECLGGLFFGEVDRPLGNFRFVGRAADPFGEAAA